MSDLDRPAHKGYPDADNTRNLVGILRRWIELSGDTRKVTVGEGDGTMVVLIHPEALEDSILVLTADDGLPVKITIEAGEG